MRLKIDVSMEYNLHSGDAVLLMLEAAHMPDQVVTSSRLDIESATLQRSAAPDPLERKTWALVEGNRLDLCYDATVDVTRSIVPLEDLVAAPLHSLSVDVLKYLRPSRFCQSDLFTDFVSKQFGDLNDGTLVRAILDWTAAHLSYVPGSSHGATTAVDTFTSGTGVCRDYAHLVCSLARAANIPARYTSVYGVDVDPPDFHAVAQVWLGGGWHIADATSMGTSDSFALIASGRDAADVAFMETPNWAHLIRQNVRVSRV